MNIQASEFGVLMQKLTRYVREGIVDPDYGTLANQGKLLVERILKFTPAKTPEQQYQAIKSDLYKIFRVVPHNVIYVLKKRGVQGGINRWLHDNGLNVHIRLEAPGVIYSLEEAIRVHRANYTSRGRTKPLPIGGRYLIAPNGVGGVGFGFATYLEFLGKRVGKAKAGWKAAALSLGVDDLEHTVARHHGNTGIFINGLNAERPFIEVYNTTPWALHREEGDRIVRSAINSRMRSMDAYVERQMKLAVQRAGFAAA